MTVLSLFDGISCGQQSLKELKIKVDQYFASEIHKPSILITQKNFPYTIQLGDVRYVNGLNLPDIDLLLAGSPCQGFSFAGKQLNFNDPRSKLFWEFVRILKECRVHNPKVQFLLENVRMKKESEKIISSALEVDPVLINSRVFGCQNRPRLYWTNIKVKQVPTRDHPQVLQDVLHKPFYKGQKERIRLVTNRSNKFKQTSKVVRVQDKSPCLVTNGRAVIISTTFKTVRCATPLEWERIQGLPDNYTLGISDRQRYHGVGNGWNIPTIKHILKGIKK